MLPRLQLLLLAPALVSALAGARRGIFFVFCFLICCTLSDLEVFPWPATSGALCTWSLLGEAVPVSQIWWQAVLAVGPSSPQINAYPLVSPFPQCHELEVT